jgi:aminoglycoside phosphotransferase (APT) family kinase protein
VRAELLVRTLADLHRRDPAQHLPPADPIQAVHVEIERWRNVGKSAGAPRVPLLDAAEIWLHRHAPVPAAVSLVHGYAGTQNVLCAGDTVLALTGWEFAHVGDPAEDWAFCVAMCSSDDVPREAWQSLIERVAGIRLTPSRWAYWEAFTLFKAACANRACLALFESGISGMPEMAINGTVVHRTLLRRLATLTA